MASDPMPPLVRRASRFCLGGLPLSALARRFGVTAARPRRPGAPSARAAAFPPGPLYAYDGARIVSNARRLQAALNGSLEPLAHRRPKRPTLALNDPQRRFSTRL
ncbi:MAG: hypothetical protein KGH63_00605, partial [Candidatus Micrarchaeota archaeon]|nr:hypothetical protein [Candidatus Micrarchaeota archaeon]